MSLPAKPTVAAASPQPPPIEGLSHRRIPKAVVKRLSLYNRVLQLLESSGTEKVNSSDLALRLGLNSAQVRKDLAYFGAFGIPGYGYNVLELRKHIKRILGTDREFLVVVVGIGNLGSALLSYGGFARQGFKIVWGFDVNPSNSQVRGPNPIPVYPISELESRLKAMRVDIAVLAVPVDAAQTVANRCVAAGIQAILNFVPVRIDVPDHVHVHYVDLALEMESLGFYVR